MKNILILLISLLLVVQLVNAAEVCVVAHYGDGEADSKCIDIDEGKSGYELMEETGWRIEWKDQGGDSGHCIASINDIGYDSGECTGDKGYWNLNIAKDSQWSFLGDMTFFDGASHYETRNGDTLGLAFGPSGSKPEMFIINISKIYIDGEKQSESKTRRGKIVDVFPGSEVKFKIELENLYDGSTDIDIIDISIEGTIEEIDDGNDIDEEIKEFDLDADKKTTKTLEFQIPLEVEAKDRLVKIELKAEDDAGIKYKKEFTYDLEVEKEDHKLKIIKAELDKETYKCGETALLGFSILNIGEKNEDVNLEITNDALSLNINEDFELTNDAFEPSSKYQKRFNIWLPNNLSKTTYPITITADYGSEKEIENVNLVIDECEIKETISESKEITETQTPQPYEEKKTEAEKESAEETTTWIGEKISGNTLIFALSAILVVLFIIIAIGLVAIFFIKK